MSFSKFTDSNVTPLSVGRGRGFCFTPVPFVLGDHQVVSPHSEHMVKTYPPQSISTSLPDPPPHNVIPGYASHSTHSQPIVDLHPPQCSSTSVSDSPSNEVSLADQMNTIVQQIGQQLADSIMSHLKTSTPVAAGNSDKCKNEDSSRCTTLDLSQVQFVTQRGVKDPPVFRGESLDTLTVDEWEESMKNYIRKTGVQLENQAEEILVHLRGRAKDVVRFGIRNGEINVQQNPNAIYGLLHKHFSANQCSSVPLADFYSTLPKEQEDPYEYWLRLNRSADVAASYLKDQGKTFDNPSIEVTRMFIRHCPNRDLALTFRSKTMDKWTAREVQEVLDEYHLEKGLRSSAGRSSRVNMNSVEVSPKATLVPEIPEQKAAFSQDTSTLERLMGMLEKVLLQGPSHARANKRPQNNRLPRVEGLNDIPCSICNDGSHSALIHCRENRLCFLCHSSGHSRRNCPEGKRSPLNSQQGN